MKRLPYFPAVFIAVLFIFEGHPDLDAILSDLLP